MTENIKLYILRNEGSYISVDEDTSFKLGKEKLDEALRDYERLYGSTERKRLNEKISAFIKESKANEALLYNYCYDSESMLNKSSTIKRFPHFRRASVDDRRYSRLCKRADLEQINEKQASKTDDFNSLIEDQDVLLKATKRPDDSQDVRPASPPSHRSDIDPKSLRRSFNPYSLSSDEKPFVNEVRNQNLTHRATLSELEKFLLNNSQSLSFNETVQKTRRGHKLEDSDVYKNARIRRSVYFQALKGNPKKATVWNIIVGLNCSLSEADAILQSAGYIRNKSKLDLVMEYLLTHKKQEEYLNITKINIILDELNEPLLTDYENSVDSAEKQSSKRSL